jgi:RNA polymerase sigma-70 factor (ECF subfamily)
MTKELEHNYQKILFPYIYNIVGSVDDSLDVAQESVIRFLNSDQDNIENPKAYLIKIAINQAINFKNLLRHQKEKYPGTWLPEPLETGAESLHQMDKEKIITYSLMVLLEKLSGKERAVYILKEIFQYNHQDISDVLNISVENSRQILRRSRKRIRQDVYDTQLKNSNLPYVKSFIRALNEHNFESLEQLLIDDITIDTDHGGKATAARNVISGRRNVIKFLKVLAKKYYHDIDAEVVEINQRAGIVFRNGNIIQTIVLFEPDQNNIRRIFIMRNPDKFTGIIKQQKANNI